MQLVEIMTEVLETGLMSMAAERQLRSLLNAPLSEVEMQVTDQFIDALTSGRIQPIASFSSQLG
jgi:hypothetical protein